MHTLITSQLLGTSCQASRQQLDKLWGGRSVFHTDTLRSSLVFHQQEQLRQCRWTLKKQPRLPCSADGWMQSHLDAALQHHCSAKTSDPTLSPRHRAAFSFHLFCRASRRLASAAACCLLRVRCVRCTISCTSSAHQGFIKTYATPPSRLHHATPKQYQTTLICRSLFHILLK